MDGWKDEGETRGEEGEEERKRKEVTTPCGVKRRDEGTKKQQHSDNNTQNQKSNRLKQTKRIKIYKTETQINQIYMM